MKTRMLAGFGLVLFAVAAVFAAEGAKIKLDGVKCVVAASKDAKDGTGVDYKGGKVFFCCMNCPKAFAANTAKFAAKANHQLVATGQAKQEKCPVSGQAVDTATKITVAGADVCFCCEKCQAKAKEATDQVEFLFNDKSFEKAGFKVAK
jgi:YHS domain-containing protein